MTTFYYFDTLTYQELEEACSVLLDEFDATPPARRPHTGIDVEVKLADAWFRYRKAQREADAALREIVALVPKRVEEAKR